MARDMVGGGFGRDRVVEPDAPGAQYACGCARYLNGYESQYERQHRGYDEDNTAHGFAFLV